MSGDFLWELEKLRRRFGVDGEGLRSATRELTVKRRGLKAQRHTGEITFERKTRRVAREQEYWKSVEEIVDCIIDESVKGKAIVNRLVELLKHDPKGHYVLRDLTDSLLNRVIKDNNISDSDRDHLEASRFHLEKIEGAPDSPGRRKYLAAHLRAIKTLLRELRVEKTT
jgi:hypothetical protein